MSAPGGGGRQRLQELSEQLQVLDQQQQQVRSEIEELRAEKREIDDAVEALETLETDSTVQVPVGGDAYVRATVDDVDEVVVGLGGGYAAEQDREDATGILRNKQDSLDDRIADLQSEVAELETESAELEQEAQQAQQQLMQQQMSQQGMGGPGGEQDE